MTPSNYPKEPPVSTFLFASTPVPAHTTNPIPFAQRLIERGHTVLWYAGRVFHEQLGRHRARSPCRSTRPRTSAASSSRSTSRSSPVSPASRRSRPPSPTCSSAQALPRVADLRRILAQHDVDAMLCDELMYGVGLTSELTGVPWATFGDGPLPYFEPDTPPFGPGLSPMRGPVGRLRNRAVGWIGRNVIFAEAQRRYDDARAELGLPAGSTGRCSRSRSRRTSTCTAPCRRSTTRASSCRRTCTGSGRCDPTPRPTGRGRSGGPRSSTSTKPVVLVSQGSIRPDLTELVEPTDPRPGRRRRPRRGHHRAGRPGRPRARVRRPAPGERSGSRSSCPTTSCSPT